MNINGNEVDLTPGDIIKELQQFRITLGQLNGEIIKLGNQKSEAEYKYRLAKAKKIVELRTEKIPVTLIADLVKGDPSIAKLKMELDAKEVLYDNKRENIRSLRDVMSMYQSILNWMKVEYQNSSL